jgi:hypothetical protein
MEVEDIGYGNADRFTLEFLGHELLLA